MKFKKLTVGLSAIMIAASASAAVSASAETDAVETDAAVSVTLSAASEETCTENAEGNTHKGPKNNKTPERPEPKAPVDKPRKAEDPKPIHSEKADKAEDPAPAKHEKDTKQVVTPKTDAAEKPETPAKPEVPETAEAPAKPEAPQPPKEVIVSVTDEKVCEDILKGVEEALENTPKAKEESWVNPLSAIDDKQMSFDLKVKHADVRPDGTIHIDGVIYSEDLSELLSYSPEKKDKEFTVPAPVKKIKDEAFKGNEHLEKIDLGKGPKEMGPEAIKDCPKLHEIVKDDKVKPEPPVKPDPKKNEDAVIEIPDCFREMVDDIFANCESIDDLVLYAIDKCSEYNFCDINADEVTDLSDFTLLSSMLLDKDNFSKIKEIVNTVIEDGVINSDDITLIKSLLVDYNVIPE